MVQVDISTQPRVLASTCSDVATLMSHPALGDCMIVDESSPLRDDVESTPTPSVTVQVNTGTTGRMWYCGTCGTVVASSQGDPKTTATVDDSKSPTLADLIKSQESLRKDQARARAKFRVELAKPKASDIESIMRLYADGQHPEWSVLAEKLEAAKPFKVSKATFPMILETGQALVRTPNGKILSSVMKDHGNPVFESLLESRAIAQVLKMPGGNLRVMVPTQDACQQLECQPITILSGLNTFFGSTFSLESKYYLDIFGVGVEEERIPILRSLHILGCPVVFATFRETVPCKGVVMSTWRVYFGCSTCPQRLVRVGKVVEQIAYDKQLYPVRGKNAPIPTDRPRFGQRGSYCLDLGAALASGTRQQPTENKKNNNNKKPNTTHTQPQNQPRAKPQQEKKTKNHARDSRGGSTNGGEASSQSGIGGEATGAKQIRPNFVGPQYCFLYHTTRVTRLITAHSSHPTFEKSIVFPSTGGEGWRNIDAVGMDARKA